MKKIFSLIIVVLFLISVAVVGLYTTKGTKLTVEGTWHTPSAICYCKQWRWPWEPIKCQGCEHKIEVSLDTSEGDMFSLNTLGIGDTGFVTMRGYLSVSGPSIVTHRQDSNGNWITETNPNELYNPDWNERYTVDFETGAKANTLFGSDIPFTLEFNRIDLHGTDGLWMDLSFEALGTTTCIPFTDFCWGSESIISSNSVTIKVGK